MTEKIRFIQSPNGGPPHYPEGDHFSSALWAEEAERSAQWAKHARVKHHRRQMVMGWINLALAIVMMLAPFVAIVLVVIWLVGR